MFGLQKQQFFTRNKFASLLLTPQLKPTIDMYMGCFIRSGGFWYLHQSALVFLDIPLEVVA